MINESMKRDPRMWEKWRESGALGKHPDQYRRDQRADLQIDPPERFHNNWQIHFNSKGKTKEWREAYADTIMRLARPKKWAPFFQFGSDTERETWQMVELLASTHLGVTREEVEAFIEVVHKEVERRYPHLFRQG